MHNAKKGKAVLSRAWMDAVCIGCGCDTMHACVDQDGNACYWLKVDYEIGLGVCSECPQYLDSPLDPDKNIIITIDN